MAQNELAPQRELVPGDIVRLKSGGPNMTIDNIKGDRTTSCIWFAKKEKLDGEFKEVSLNLVQS